MPEVPRLCACLAPQIKSIIQTLMCVQRVCTILVRNLQVIHVYGILEKMCEATSLHHTVGFVACSVDYSNRDRSPIARNAAARLPALSPMQQPGQE
jgi:hypothetical protein